MSQAIRIEQDSKEIRRCISQGHDIALRRVHDLCRSLPKRLLASAAVRHRTAQSGVAPYPSRLDDDLLGQVDELLVRGGSIDEGQDREAPPALERRQRMVPGVRAIVY